jgi:hypothetical protein
MEKSKTTSRARKSEALDQVSSPDITNEQEIITSDDLTNEEIVLKYKSFRYEAKADEISIISQGNEYTSGKRANDGKTFTRFRLVTDNEKVLEVLENISNFDGGASFIVCEQERPKDIATIENDDFDTVVLTIGLRLADPNDEDSDILSNVNLMKAVPLESASKRETLALQRDKIASDRAKYQAQKRFYSSSKMDDVLSNSLLSALQTS